MRALVFGIAGFLVVGAAGGQEPQLPKSLRRPDTAFARAQADGKKIAVVVKLVHTEAEVRVAERVVIEKVEKVVNGTKVIETVPVKQTYAYQVEVPKGFREVKLLGADVKARDAAGNTVPVGKLPALLAAETPVLVATTPDPVDPFHLLTTKPGTLVLHVDPAKLAPPKAAGPPPLPPGVVPATPAPGTRPPAK